MIDLLSLARKAQEVDGLLFSVSDLPAQNPA
jgi:hypothetical protein